MKFIQQHEWDKKGYCLSSVYEPGQLESFYEMAEDLPVELATEAVNAVDSQGISHVSVAKRSYVNEGRVLHLARLSTAEKIFLVCEIAKYINLELTVYRVLSQLDYTVLLRFLRRYRSCKNITIIDDGYFIKAVSEEGTVC